MQVKVARSRPMSVVIARFRPTCIRRQCARVSERRVDGSEGIFLSGHYGLVTALKGPDGTVVDDLNDN